MGKNQGYLEAEADQDQSEAEEEQEPVVGMAGYVKTFHDVKSAGRSKQHGNTENDKSIGHGVLLNSYDITT